MVNASATHVIREVGATWSAPSTGNVLIRNVFVTHSWDGEVLFAKFQDVQESAKIAVLMGFVTVLTTNVYVTQVHKFEF